MYKKYGFNKEGIAVTAKGKRIFSSEFRVRVLEALDSGKGPDVVAAENKLTRRELGCIVAWRKNVKKAPERIALVQRERGLRERLFEKAVGAVENSMEPVGKVIEGNPLLQGMRGMSHLPTVVAHLRNAGQTGVKVLEGLGDFRKGGDDVPRDAPRQPLFNLPPGSHVAVTVDISTSKGEISDGLAEQRDIERG